MKEGTIMNKIVFFGGKGGVGKTTCSASFALNCALQGKKTLLVSTDPAHSISDIFEKPIGGKIINIDKNLDALEIDSAVESRKYMDGVRANLKNVLSPIIVKEIKKQINAAAVSPGTEEAALFDKMIEIINDKSSEYDQIVFDTAPTGHTVRLMSLPELLGAWIKSLIDKRKKALSIMQMANNAGKKNVDEVENDEVIKILRKRLENMENARTVITDNNRLSFIFVLNAEKLAIEETVKAIKILDTYKIKVDSLIVNRILPEDSVDEFWKGRKELENKYLVEIHNAFKGKNIIKIPMLSSDMRADNIKDVAKYF
jgi:arsenite-transporting ATPase